MHVKSCSDAKLSLQLDTDSAKRTSSLLQLAFRHLKIFPLEAGLSLDHDEVIQAWTRHQSAACCSSSSSGPVVGQADAPVHLSLIQPSLFLSPSLPSLSLTLPLLCCSPELPELIFFEGHTRKRDARSSCLMRCHFLLCSPSPSATLLSLSALFCRSDSLPTVSSVISHVPSLLLPFSSAASQFAFSHLLLIRVFLFSPHCLQPAGLSAPLSASYLPSSILLPLFFLPCFSMRFPTPVVYLSEGAPRILSKAEIFHLQTFIHELMCVYVCGTRKK